MCVPCVFHPNRVYRSRALCQSGAAAVCIRTCVHLCMRSVYTAKPQACVLHVVWGCEVTQHLFFHTHTSQGCSYQSMLVVCEWPLTHCFIPVVHPSSFCDIAVVCTLSADPFYGAVCVGCHPPTGGGPNNPWSMKASRKSTPLFFFLGNAVECVCFVYVQGVQHIARTCMIFVCRGTGCFSN